MHAYAALICMPIVHCGTLVRALLHNADAQVHTCVHAHCLLQGFSTSVQGSSTSVQAGCKAGIPTLGLWVGTTGIAVGCNELGFTEADVRALCDVGASSKAKAKAVQPSAAAAVSSPEGMAAGSKQGQTGEKGIGEWWVGTI